MKTVETQAEISANDHGRIYVHQENIRVWQGSDSIMILDLRNAMLRGQTCKEVTIRDWKESCAAVNYVGGRYAEMLAEHSENSESGSFAIYVSEVPAMRVFSPFALNRVNPLKAKPAKWTIPHVLRALFNGQFEDLKCNGVYSDDYAFDNAVNYQKGAIKNAIDFAQGILESPSGWWTSEREGIVHICCHSFDSNEFRPAI